MDAPQTPIDPRETLTAERTRVFAEISESEVIAPGQMTYGSQAAAASHVFEQQRDLALRDHNQAHLVAIDEAIARIGAGTYGLCTACHKSVPAERLEALPWTALCIECSRSVPRRR